MTKTTRALTLHQPWASLVIFGGKNVENRSWKPSKSVLGKRIAIHAGKTVDRRDWVLTFAKNAGLKDIKTGGIVGTVRVIGWVHDDAGTLDFYFDPITGLSNRQQFARAQKVRKSVWWMGPVGWVLAWPRVCRFFPCSGRQGLWVPPAEWKGK